MTHNHKRGDFKKVERERESIRTRRRLKEWTPLNLIEPDPDDLCDDCGMPVEDCECCPTGEHNPGDPNCVCDLSEPGDRGRKV